MEIKVPFVGNCPTKRQHFAAYEDGVAISKPFFTCPICNESHEITNLDMLQSLKIPEMDNKVRVRFIGIGSSPHKCVIELLKRNAEAIGMDLLKGSLMNDEILDVLVKNPIEPEAIRTMLIRDGEYVVSSPQDKENYIYAFRVDTPLEEVYVAGVVAEVFITPPNESGLKHFFVALGDVVIGDAVEYFGETNWW